jgi:hypothetical protein
VPAQKLAITAAVHIGYVQLIEMPAPFVKQRCQIAPAVVVISASMALQIIAFIGNPSSNIVSVATEPDRDATTTPIGRSDSACPIDNPLGSSGASRARRNSYYPGITCWVSNWLHSAVTSSTVDL